MPAKQGSVWRRRPQVDWLVLSVALVAASWVVSSTWERVKTQPKNRTIRVTGSAKKRIVSDLIQWTATIEVHNPDRAAGYRELRKFVDQTKGYVTDAGIESEDIRVSSASSVEQFENEFVGVGDERIQRMVARGYSLSQNIVVSSHDVAAVERVSREVTQLLEQGVPITSASPEYLYTKLGELKIEMLAAASKDARNRAEHIVESAGSDRISRLISADMGIININPPNSRASSWDGNNDTSSLDKDIITIVHASFELEDD